MGVFRKIKMAAFLLMLLFLCFGCNGRDKEDAADIQFTVCGESKLPEELFKIIEEKKSKPFKISYTNGSYMYIVVGYGKMPATNYHVAVEKLYSTSRAIYIETNLFTEEMTPTNAKAQGDNSMYPYIVVKCEKYDIPVIYDTE